MYNLLGMLVYRSCFKRHTHMNIQSFSDLLFITMSLILFLHVLSWFLFFIHPSQLKYIRLAKLIKCFVFTLKVLNIENYFSSTATISKVHFIQNNIFIFINSFYFTLKKTEKIEGLNFVFEDFKNNAFDNFMFRYVSCKQCIIPLSL